MLVCGYRVAALPLKVMTLLYEGECFLLYDQLSLTVFRRFLELHKFTKVKRQL